MNRMVRFVSIFVFISLVQLHFTWCAETNSKNNDEIRAHFQEAKNTYHKQCIDAVTRMMQAFDLEIDKASKSGNYELVKTLSTEKKDFASDRSKLPSTAPMRKARRDYLATMKNAQRTMKDAYDNAVAGYTRAKKIPEATLIDGERKGFESNLQVIHPPKATPEKGDAFQAYTIWAGEGYWSDSPNERHPENLLLIVTERSQNVFNSPLK